MRHCGQRYGCFNGALLLQPTVNPGDGGEAKCVATMKAGDHKTCFGEIGLLEGARRSATLIAESDALQCAVVDRAAFDAIVKVLFL